MAPPSLVHRRRRWRASRRSACTGCRTAMALARRHRRREDGRWTGSDRRRGRISTGGGATWLPTCCRQPYRCTATRGRRGVLAHRLFDNIVQSASKGMSRGRRGGAACRVACVSGSVAHISANGWRRRARRRLVASMACDCVVAVRGVAKTACGAPPWRHPGNERICHWPFIYLRRQALVYAAAA